MSYGDAAFSLRVNLFSVIVCFLFVCIVRQFFALVGSVIARLMDFFHFYIISFFHLLLADRFFERATVHRVGHSSVRFVDNRIGELSHHQIRTRRA